MCILFSFYIFIVRWAVFAAELKMDVIREREVKDSFERQLADEKRLRGKSART